MLILKGVIAFGSCFSPAVVAEESTSNAAEPIVMIPVQQRFMLVLQAPRNRGSGWRKVLLLQLLKRHIHDRIRPPIAVIEMPPFGFVDAEAFGLHRLAQQVALPALERRAAEVIRIRAVAELVVAAGHED